ncbi:hypothetical protein NMY22_g14243 [Coprinellus aureogranulatus]|nr:hypothetical protein NMY22_g14243 [Coprinellus aureogranulatus]
MKAMEGTGDPVPFTVLPNKVQICILRWMPLSSAISVSQGSKECYRTFKRYVRSQVDACLRPFDLPKTETLAFMREQKAVASGSAVLRILNPDMGLPGDLDLYVPRGSMDSAHAFLITHSYYLSKSYPEGWKPAGWGETGIRQVRYYTHKETSALVNVIETSLPSAPSAVFLFHSTVVMNYLTWNSVVCAYPLTTLSGYSLLNSSRFGEARRIHACVEKYKRRGYTFVTTSLECIGFPNPHTCGVFPYCGHTERHVGDSATMRLTMDEDPFGAADVVDPGLKWLLSCKRGYCGLTEYNPYEGWVETGGEEKLHHTMTAFSAYASYAARTDGGTL